MNLFRRRFLSLLGVPAVAPLACLAANRKPKFPRWFQRVPVERCDYSCLLFAAHGLRDIEGFWPNGQTARPMHLAVPTGDWAGPNQEATLAWLQAQTAQGNFREITAAEAQALLKPKPWRLNLRLPYLDKLAADNAAVWPTKRYSNKELLRMFKPIPPWPGDKP